MKYFSEKTNKVYNTIADLEAAELEQQRAENLEKVRREREERIAREQAEQQKREKEQLAAERKADAEKVAAAYDEVTKAKENYRKELENFCKKHGSYHATLSEKEIPTLFDLIPHSLVELFNFKG